VFKNKLLFVLLVILAVTVIVLATKSVSAGDGTHGGMGGIITTLIS